MKKPSDIFDRDAEWRALDEFVANLHGVAHLGIVYGRRRQGKSWLLERLADTYGGFYWEAIEGTRKQQLDSFVLHLQEHTKSSFPFSFSDWEKVFQSMTTGNIPFVVIDEFQYLLETSPEVASILQKHINRKGASFLLCGSAMGSMRKLLDYSAPLRGRATLELVVKPFPFREAAQYWSVKKNHVDAMKLHALLGGTPAYREFINRKSPSDFPSFREWVCKAVLNPSNAIFREGKILTHELVSGDKTLYNGLLTAIAQKNSRRGQIATALGKSENTLAHHLNTLVDLDLIYRVEDPLHMRKSSYHLSDPLLRLYQLIIAPYQRIIESRGATVVWESIENTLVSSQIFGPHYEHLMREWLSAHASITTLGALPDSLGPSIVNDKEAKKQRETDVVVLSGGEVIALGEAKFLQKFVDVDVLKDLEEKRVLLGEKAQNAKLILCSASGFKKELRVLARKRSDVELVDIERLYEGD